MYKLAALLLVGLALNFGWQEQDEPPPNPEMQRQEIINLEHEAARAIQTWPCARSRFTPRPSTRKRPYQNWASTTLAAALRNQTAA